MVSAFLLAVAVLPQQPLHTQAEGRAGSFDSTRAVIVTVGKAVADVKSGLDVYRRAAFNGTSGDLEDAAAYLRRACGDLDSVARLAERRICRRCADRALQDALDGYRTAMPLLRRTGARCAVDIARRSRGPDTTVTRRLRGAVRLLTEVIVSGFVPYERRLAVVRVAAGWAPAPVPPDRERPLARQRA